jgi:hypothetical protein
MVLRELQDGHTLTPAKALVGFGCMRLAARIQELRDQGWDIVTNMAVGPDGRRYAEYYLES